MKNIFKYLLAFILVLSMSNISVMAVEKTTSFDAPISGSLTASDLSVEGMLNYKDENIPFHGEITASNSIPDELLPNVEGLGGDSAKFEGKIGDESSTDYSLNGDLEATVNYNGVDTMFGTVTMADNTKLFINAYFDGEDNAFVGMLTEADPRNETLIIGDLFVENFEDDKIPVRHPVQLANNGTLNDEAILWDVYANDREKVDVELDGKLTAITNESFLIHAKALDGTHRWVSKTFSSIGFVTIHEQENSNFSTVQDAVANANENETILIDEKYLHNDELVTINKSLTIVGPDQIQRESQFGQITAGINITDSSEVTLKDLYVTGYPNIRVGSYGSGSSNIIRVNSGSRLIADNIVVHEPDASIYTAEGENGITSIGIMLARGSSASISNSTIEINNAPRFSYAIYTHPTTAQGDQVISISNNVFFINSGGPLYSDWIQHNIGIMMDINEASGVNDTNIEDYVVLNGNSYNVPEEQLEHAANIRVGSAFLTEQQVKSIVDIYLPEHGRAHVTWAGVAWQWYPYPDKVTITFDLGVEEMEIDPIYQTINTSVILPTPERSYYTFDGWYLDQDYTTEFTSDFMPVEDTELYAKWNIHTYTVTFNDYDGTKIEDVTVDHGSDATPPANPTREGHTFNGWNAIFTNVTSDLTIVATYLSKVVEAETKDFPKLEVEGLDDLDKLGITFTDEEKEKDVSVILVLELQKDEDVPKADKDLLDAYLEANANIDSPMSLLLDISMLKIVGDSASAINELASPITISFEAPFAFRNIDFELLRVHDGKVESLDYDYNAETFILTFETDKFSTYALAEVAVESEDETDPVEEEDETDQVEEDEKETVIEDDDDEEEEKETLVPDMSDNGFRNIAYVSMLLGSLLVLLGSKRKLFAKITK